MRLTTRGWQSISFLTSSPPHRKADKHETEEEDCGRFRHSHHARCITPGLVHSGGEDRVGNWVAIVVYSIEPVLGSGSGRRRSLGLYGIEARDKMTRVRAPVHGQINACAVLAGIACEEAHRVSDSLCRDLSGNAAVFGIGHGLG